MIISKNDLRVIDKKDKKAMENCEKCVIIRVEKKFWVKGGIVLANEVLKKIQEAEKEADEIIFSANESAKRILKDIELKIKSNNEKVISDVNQESEKLKNEVVKDADNAVNILLKEEEGYINSILNIDEARIDEVVKLLAERIVR